MPVYLEEIRVNVNEQNEYWNPDEGAWYPLSELTRIGWKQVGGVMPSTRFLGEFVMWFRYEPKQPTGEQGA